MNFTFKIIKLAVVMAAVAALNAANPESMMRQGGRWTDTDGNFINAHGGGMLWHEGVYYWYGECKGDKTYRTPGVEWECYRTEAGGVTCYSSRDLRNWKFEGVALSPDTVDTASDIHPSMVIERPKVIYNDNTRKFVMWMHIDNADYSAARSGVAVSDSPVGPFVYLGSVRPDGSESRDMTLFKDDDGTAYHIYSSEGNSTLHVSRLTDDYLSHSGSYTRCLPGRFREAPALFKHNGLYYMVTSGCSGWSPNEAEYAVASDVQGPWTAVSNPCKGVDADKTFYGQSTFVLPVDNGGGKISFVMMFDRWNKTNLIDSRYIWLPVTLDDGALAINWNDIVELPEINLPVDPATE